ncbi:MAG: alpha-2-macroglobulin, partial [Rhodobacteraceae bacterium]|nr:alpha-2-macroglobulin [Paracoccaceae bacterium]
LVSRANSVIGTVTTDDEGYALFTPAQVAGTGSSAPALVTAEEAEDYSFLSLTDPEFDLSDRGVEGRPAAPAVDVFLATDRGAYRAGETLNATILARDPTVQGIEGLPLTARLIRPDGVEYSRALAPDAGAGGRAVSFPLDGSAPRGTWRIEVFAEDDNDTLASEPFLVEDFLPERIDFALTLPEGPMRATDEAQIAIAARYLFGAPGADLPIEGDYRITAADGLADWPGYQFGKYDESFSPSYDSISDAGQTDAEGNSTLFVTLPDLGPNSDRPLTARYAVRLTEGSGRPVERTIERPLYPAKPFIGIKPAFKDGVVGEKSEAAFDLSALGPAGKPAAMPVHWKLNRVETHYQWYALYGQWSWDVTTSRSTVAEGDATLDGGPVAVKGMVDWGDYELVVTATDGSQSVASTQFYAGWYVPADTVSTPDTLDIALDKPAYKAGDVAQVHIVPRAAGVALITVMSNHLIAMKAVEVSEGENTVELPVTDDWGAGAYVTASVLRPMDGSAARTPARSLGLSYAKVDPGAKRLVTTIEATAESDPRAPLPVAVKVDGVASGEQAYVTLAAVDVGILNLTATLPPDPEDHYFGQQKLGMAIRDLYGRLIDGQNGAPGTVRSGGDAGGVKLKAPPPTEELVAYFSGPIAVDADGYARTEFAMPSFNGTVKLMAIAWSKSAIGQASQDVLVRDPVVVTASVPRFLAPGDHSTLRLEIVHATGPSGRMGLDVTAQGVTLGSAPSGVDLADKGKASLTIPLTAPDSEGNTNLRVALTTPDGKQLVKSLTIPVQANDPETMRQSQFTLAPGKEFTLDANVFTGFMPGSGKATLALGPIGRFNVPGILAALDRYPYGCTEQMTSKALPLLYYEDVATAMGAAGDTTGIRERVQQAIGEILLNQSANGAFGLWYPDTGDMWLDAYVTDFLSRAKAQGYQVPDTAFRNALDNLRNQINYQSDFDRDSTGIAYALMVLAREGAAAIGDLRYYADVKANAFDTPISAAQLGAALASYGDQTRADTMFRQASSLVAANIAESEAQVWRADYGSNLRDATAVLALAGEAGSSAIPAEKLGQSVAASLMKRSLSTQESTWALLATHAMTSGQAAEQFSLNGAPLTGPLVRVIEDQTAGGASQTIANSGKAEATLTLTTFGIPSEPEPARGNGYQITRSWYTMEGEPVSLDQVKQGTRMVAVIEVTPLGSGEARLMINDPLPAGFEIDNPNLIRGGDVAALDWLTTMDSPRTTEFRQDRFLAAVDWTSSEPFRLAYVVRAISPGSYRLPAASVEDMYRPDYRAITDSGRVTVSE